MKNIIKGNSNFWAKSEMCLNYRNNFYFSYRNNFYCTDIYKDISNFIESKRLGMEYWFMMGRVESSLEL